MAFEQLIALWLAFTGGFAAGIAYTLICYALALGRRRLARGRSPESLDATHIEAWRRARAAGRKS